MAEDRHQTFNNGALVSEKVVPVTPEDGKRRGSTARLDAAYALLDTWANEAGSQYSSWPTLTLLQKDEVQRLLVQRFGQLCANVTDIILLLKR